MYLMPLVLTSHILSKKIIFVYLISQDICASSQFSGIPEECVITNGQGFWNDVPCENWNTALCRKVSEHSFCKLDYDKRDDCGWYGVEQEECISMGCCWNPTPEDVPGEWCFHPSNSVNCLNEGGQCIPNSRANNCNRGIKDSLCQNEGTSGGEQVCCLSCSSKGVDQNVLLQL